MKDLITGVKTYWDSLPEITSRFPGGVHLSEAPKGVNTDGYAVFNLSEAPTPRTWSDTHSEYDLFFSLYMTGSSAEPLITAADLVNSKFDVSRFPIENWYIIHFLYSLGTRPKRVDDIWSIELQYRCILQKCD